MRSLGARFVAVGFLCLVMFIPLLMVSDIVNSRKSYSEDTIRSVGREWGGAQTISGPQIVVPVQARVTVQELRNVINPVTGLVERDPETGKNLQKLVEEERIEPREPIYIYPDLFDVRISTETQMRHRGIFQVPVYQATASITAEFPFDRVEANLGEGEFLLWDAAQFRLYVSSNKALRGDASLSAGDEDILLEPLGGQAGLVAVLPQGKDQTKFELSLGFNGAERLQIAPVGRVSMVDMTSDWPHPSFGGEFLPDGSEITDTGFTANWTIPHLARSLPQIARSNMEGTSRSETAFGVSFYQPNDFYQKAWRASRYGILFVSLTFLTVLLIDMQSRKPVHPVQYLLIGLSQAVFTLLMLAYAEQVGFGPAYLGAAAAVIILLVLFGKFGLKLGSRVWVLGAMLVLLYAVLYLILYSTDYALLAGATLAFIAIGATMYATRNEEWYSEEALTGPGWFARRSEKKAQAAALAAAQAAAQATKES